MATRDSIGLPRDEATLTIPLNQTESNELQTGGMCLTGLEIPASWTQCDLTFKAAKNPDSQLGTLRDKTGPVKILNVVAGERISLEPSVFAGWTRIVIVCSTAQLAARDVVAVLRAVS